MTDGEAAPPQSRLLWIAKANIVLGIVSLVRFAPELLTVISKGPKAAYYALVALDLAIGAVWLKSGLALRKHGRAALGFVAIAGAIVIAHAITSGIIVGKELLRGLSGRENSPNYFLMLAITGSRFLIYGLEFLFWPYALLVLLRQAEDPDGDPTPRRSVLIAMIGAFLISALVQTVILAAIFDR